MKRSMDPEVDSRLARTPAGSAVPTETRADNTMAVCGCGKVFVPDEQTEYLKVGGKSYACCSPECHEFAEKDPKAAVKLWEKEMARFANGGHATREDIYADMQAKLGVVPTMFKLLPDESLEAEWNLMSKIQMEPGSIPNKYRELIGVAISGVMKCRYCSYFHTEMAKVSGATQAEIEEAVHYAKSSSGWSAYVNGLQIDFDQFKREIDQASAYARKQMARQSN